METSATNNIDAGQEPKKHPYYVEAGSFEGPLDLLLHLIKENEVNIYDIPISEITSQYLKYIDMMKVLNLDIAGEFLVMAATLAHIKSQILLPPDESQEDPEEEGLDPRAELVRRLLEYQKYKNASEILWNRPLLHRDVFKREHVYVPKAPTDEPPELVEISIFKLVEAFYRVLDNYHENNPVDVQKESISIIECVESITGAIRASQEGTIEFSKLFENRGTKGSIIATFLALLEMLKRGALRVYQQDEFGEIHLMGTPKLFDGDVEYDAGSTPTEQA